jgi:hypothetical protein
MSKNTLTPRTPPAPAQPSETLSKYYAKYLEFVTRLAEELKWPHVAEELKCPQVKAKRTFYNIYEFQDWWTSLEPAQQAAYDREFDRGYDAVLQEVAQQVRAVVDGLGRKE